MWTSVRTTLFPLAVVQGVEEDRGLGFAPPHSLEDQDAEGRFLYFTSSGTPSGL